MKSTNTPEVIHIGLYLCYKQEICHCILNLLDALTVLIHSGYLQYCSVIRNSAFVKKIQGTIIVFLLFQLCQSLYCIDYFNPTHSWLLMSHSQKLLWKERNLQRTITGILFEEKFCPFCRSRGIFCCCCVIFFMQEFCCNNQ